MKNVQSIEELFEQFTAREIIETLEAFDLVLVQTGLKKNLDEAFLLRWEFTIYLLKRVVRDLEPPSCPPSSLN
jgi:hypothetical protein